MCPFIIKIKVNEPNTAVKFDIIKFGYDLNFEAHTDDAPQNTFEPFEGTYKHTFSNPGTYRIAFRGNIPGLYIRNGEFYDVIDVCQWGDIEWKSMMAMFWGCDKLNISASDAPNLSCVTSLYRMFKGCTKLNAPLNHWDTSHITDMSGMFWEASSFNQPLDHWNTSNVVYMRFMFCLARAFNQPINSWDTSHVEDMSHMFDQAHAFNQPLDRWDTANVTDMTELFHDAVSFNQTLNHWNVDKVLNSENIFENCPLLCERSKTLLRKLELAALKMDSSCFIIQVKVKKPNTTVKFEINCFYNDVIDYEALSYSSKDSIYEHFDGFFSHTFKSPGKYYITFRGNIPGLYIRNGTNYAVIDVCQWGNISWKQMGLMFADCNELNISAIDAPDLSQVTSLYNMFKGCTKLNAPLNHWDTSHITNMSGMFWEASSFNQSLNHWDTSKVTNMSCMFQYARSFNQPLNHWNTSKVTDMSCMFQYARSFNQPLNNWNTSKVTDMNSMFRYTIMFNQPLNNWNTSKVTDMNSMFRYTIMFNQPLNNWNTSKVTNMSRMFNSALSFDQSLDKWDLSSVQHCDATFRFCQNLSKENRDKMLNNPEWKTRRSQTEL